MILDFNNEKQPLMVGEATFRVIKCEEKRSENNNVYFSLQLSCQQEGRSGLVFDGLSGSPTMMWKIRHFLRSVGFGNLIKDNKLNLQIQHVYNQSGQCKLKLKMKDGVVQTYNGLPQLEVEDYIEAESQLENPVPSTPSFSSFDSQLNDDIPF